MAAGNAPELLRAAWAMHQGVMCVGLNWERQGESHMDECELALTFLPLRVLATTCA